MVAIRLHHAPKSVEDIIIHANIELTNGLLHEANNHYNEVLYNLSPAHVCAFLNRSLVFLRHGYYELAVIDAYRASIATTALLMVRAPA